MLVTDGRGLLNNDGISEITKKIKGDMIELVVMSVGNDCGNIAIADKLPVG